MKRLTVIFLILMLSCTLLLSCSSSSESTSESAPLLTQSEDGYVIFLPKCNQTVKVYPNYVPHLTYVTDELIRNADAVISKILEENPDDYPYVGLTINEEGYLCLYTELIVDLAPGEEDQPGGCPGHDHIYFKEPITTQPIK